MKSICTKCHLLIENDIGQGEDNAICQQIPFSR